MKIIHPLPKMRQAVLTQRRNLKMARSAHAYVRGNTVKFYEWLHSLRTDELPVGPPIWICGDCHLGNLGPIANASGRVEIGIRDLDQTVIGNPAHDLVRLGLSFATAARGSDLPGVTTAHILENMIQGYEQSLADPKSNSANKANETEPITAVLQKALKRKWHHLAEERIEDISPAIPLGECFWPPSAAERRDITRLFETEDVRTLITSLGQRDSGDKVRIADVAYWVKGCSSLGRLRYAAIVKVGKRKKGIPGFCLMDIKEATKAAAPSAPGASMPRDNAKRVVAGAQKLSPFLGSRMLAATVCERSVVVRELLPQDLKLELENLTQEEAVGAARFLAGVVGQAHGRQMSESDRRKWLAELQRNRSKNLDAPSWLWTAVVDLSAIHEKAYLDHCRRYALETRVR